MVDPILALVLTMLFWTALIVYTCRRASLEERRRLKPKPRSGQGSERSKLQ